MAHPLLSRVAVCPLIMREGKFLCQRRTKTGYMDGYWDLAGTGHVDEGETASQALIRECREELGIEVKRDAVHFAHLAQNCQSQNDTAYLYLYFVVTDFSGEVVLNEPDKHSGLTWFSLDELPDKFLSIHKAVLMQLPAGLYSEWTS